MRDCVDKAPEFGACYWYLAREELGEGRLDTAHDLAQRGLQAQEEVAKARRLEATLRKSPAPPL